MIHLKEKVVIDHRTAPQMFEAMIVVDRVLYHNYAVKECLVTSGNDGKHMKGSLHYEGKALDFRTSNWPMGRQEAILTEIKRSLGTDYDCLLECMGTPNQHLHIEYDPKVKKK